MALAACAVAGIALALPVVHAQELPTKAARDAASVPNNAGDEGQPAATTPGTDGARAALDRGNALWLNGNRDGASENWRMAAHLGEADAQYNLGIVLLRDPADTNEALEWLDRAARQEHTLACFALGTQLAGEDPQRAEALLHCAARNGYVPAQHNLAQLLASAGRYAEARTWFETAAVTFAPAARALSALPRPEPGPVSVVDEEALPAAQPAVHSLEWVLAQPSERYTLQVAAGSSAETLRRMLERHIGGQPAASFFHRPRSREPFSAVIGSFEDFAAAEKALAELPATLQANAPWIRRFGTLQRELRVRADEMAQLPVPETEQR